MTKIDLGYLKKLDRKATPGEWWNESGVIHAKATNWTPECHRCCHPVRCDKDDDAELVAEYRNKTPRLIEWAERALPVIENILRREEFSCRTSCRADETHCISCHSGQEIRALRELLGQVTVRSFNRSPLRWQGKCSCSRSR